MARLVVCFCTQLACFCFVLFLIFVNIYFLGSAAVASRIPDFSSNWHFVCCAFTHQAWMFSIVSTCGGRKTKVQLFPQIGMFSDWFVFVIFLFSIFPTCGRRYPHNFCQISFLSDVSSISVFRIFHLFWTCGGAMSKCQRIFTFSLFFRLAAAASRFPNFCQNWPLVSIELFHCSILLLLCDLQLPRVEQTPTCDGLWRNWRKSGFGRLEAAATRKELKIWNNSPWFGRDHVARGSYVYEYIHRYVHIYIYLHINTYIHT